jgi:hypothetical protein
MDRLAEIDNDLDVMLEEIKGWRNHTTHSFEMIIIAIAVVVYCRRPGSHYQFHHNRD